MKGKDGRPMETALGSRVYKWFSSYFSISSKVIHLPSIFKDENKKHAERIKTALFGLNFAFFNKAQAEIQYTLCVLR